MSPTRILAPLLFGPCMPDLARAYDPGRHRLKHSRPLNENDGEFARALAVFEAQREDAVNVLARLGEITDLQALKLLNCRARHWVENPTPSEEQTRGCRSAICAFCHARETFQFLGELGVLNATPDQQVIFLTARRQSYEGFDCQSARMRKGLMILEALSQCPGERVLFRTAFRPALERGKPDEIVFAALSEPFGSELTPSMTSLSQRRLRMTPEVICCGDETRLCDALAEGFSFAPGLLMPFGCGNDAAWSFRQSDWLECIGGGIKTFSTRIVNRRDRAREASIH